MTRWTALCCKSFEKTRKEIPPAVSRRYLFSSLLKERSRELLGGSDLAFGKEVEMVARPGLLFEREKRGTFGWQRSNYAKTRRCVPRSSLLGGSERTSRKRGGDSCSSGASF